MSMSTLAIRRLQREYLQSKKEPIDFVRAVTPLEDNLHECHFCVSYIQ